MGRCLFLYSVLVPGSCFFLVSRDQNAAIVQGERRQEMERPENRAERRRGDVQEVPCLDDTSSNTIMQWTRDQCRPLRAQWAQVRL